MYITQKQPIGLLKNKCFILFFTSQGISTFGDALRFIATTALLIKITGSSLSAGVGLIFSIVPNIILSLFAGYIGDVLPGKLPMVWIEFLRGIIAILFINIDSPAFIYLLLILLSSLDSIYNPPLRKVMVNIIGKKDILYGNSLLSGFSGVANILGSVLGGIFISTWGISLIFLINCYSHVISALLLLFIQLNKHISTDSLSGNAYHGIKSAFFYLKNKKQIKEIMLTNAVICFGGISINLAFYPFAFDILKVNEKGWGVMMSIFYGANMIAMFISLYLQHKIKKIGKSLIYSLAFVVSGIWFLYSVMEDLPMILILQLIEGTSLSLCTIFLVSRLQLLTDENYMSRITGIFDFTGMMGKVPAIALTYILINIFSVKYVFIVSSLILLVYALYKLLSGKHRNVLGKAYRY